MENKTEGKQKNTKVKINFVKNKMEEQPYKVYFLGTEFEVKTNIEHDRYVAISKVLLSKMRSEIMTREIFTLQSMDIYKLVSEFKTLILDYMTDVDVFEYSFPVMDESGFVDMALNLIDNYKEKFDLFLMEISILNTQLIMMQLSNAIPNAENTVGQFTKAMEQLSDTDKELFEMVVGKKLKDEIIDGTKEEKKRKKDANIAMQRARLQDKKKKKVS